MADASAPKLLPDGRARAEYLIPLWSWLAVFTVTIGVYFHGASQGAPWQISFGATLTDPDKIRGQLAGLWGVPLLGLSAIALYRLTLRWMERNYAASEAPLSRWERLPAPLFWKLPSSDGVTRALRTGVWILILVLVPFSLGHLARKHFEITFYQRCADVLEPGCEYMPEPGRSASNLRPFRAFTHESSEQLFLLHLAPQHLRAPKYWDHTFYAGGPSYLTYFPGPQAWVYVALVIVAYWLWLRIVLSVLAGRVVLDAPLTTLTGWWRSRRHRVRAVSNAWPAPRVRVGVIGHRSLTACQLDQVRDGLDTALAACHRDGYVLRVVSGLATGTDRLAVDWALDRDDVELLAIVPSDLASFRDFSAVDDPTAFNAQVERIQGHDTRRLMELPGVISRPETPAEEASARISRIAAHRYKSSVTVRQCEFLIAAMDLNDPGKPGGTRECVEQALALGTPVLVIEIGHNGDNGHSGSPVLSLITRLDQLRQGALPSDGLEAFKSALKQQLPALDTARIPRDLGALDRVYRAARPSSLARFSGWWGRLEAFCGIAQRKPGKRNAIDSTASFDNLRRRIADDQSDLMAAYRGSFVTAYLLGLAAVFLALLIVLIFWGSAGDAKALMLGLTLLKLVCVGTIAWIIKQSEEEKLSELSVALRYISERLRIMPVLAQLGSARLDLLHQSQRMGEPARVAEDLCRRVSLTEICRQFKHDDEGKAALESLCKLQNDQQMYNAKGHQKSRQIHHTLEAWVRGSAKAVIWIIALDILLLFIKIGRAHDCVPPFLGDHWLKPIGLILILLTALLPAIMATANALLFQIQAEQLAARQADLASTFARHLKLSERLAQDIAKGRAPQPINAAILIEAERSAAVLAEEVAEWAVMSKQALKEA